MEACFSSMLCDVDMTIHYLCDAGIIIIHHLYKTYNILNSSLI